MRRQERFAGVELEHYATGDAAGRVFALGVVEAERSMIRGAAFSAADLTAERIGIYRVQDGKRLTSVRVLSPSGAEQTLMPGVRVGAALARVPALNRVPRLAETPI